ncbi:MAG: DNA polymerase III subunit beta [Betaproteobacteria bacterium]|nr:DNA polymerase III subunit beta [Betaproteobacteria bacterium]
MALMKASRDALLRPLQIVAGLTDKKSTMPILANILIRKAGENVDFVATDTELQITTQAALSDQSDDAAITVSARKLIDVLRSLPDLLEVSLSVQGTRASIQAGRSRITLQTMPADEFPELLLHESCDAELSISQRSFRQLLSMVHFAMAEQDVRYYLNGMLVVAEGTLLRAVATDGHRLACFELQTDHELPRYDLIVPRRTVNELLRLLSDSEDLIRLEIFQSRLRMKFGGIEVVSKLVEGRYPDYERVIPRNLNRKARIHRQSLVACLNRAAVVTTEKQKGVRLSFTNNLLAIQTRNADQEEVDDEIAIVYSDEETEIGFNLSYLREVFSQLQCEEVIVSLRDGASSVLISIPDSDAFRYVLMPMRM